MENVTSCPDCRSRTLFRSPEVEAGGSRGPDLLPGLARSWFRPARFVLVVCRDCGLTRFYAEPEARKKLGESGKWKRV